MDKGTAKNWTTQIEQRFNLKSFLINKGSLFWLQSAAISPDGKTVVSGSWDNTVKVWGMESDGGLYTLGDHSWSVYKVVISPVSPVGKRQFARTNDSTIKVWDIESGECIYADNTEKVSDTALSESKLTDEEIVALRHLCIP